MNNQRYILGDLGGKEEERGKCDQAGENQLTNFLKKIYSLSILAYNKTTRALL